MKRLLSALIVACCAAALVPSAASAQQAAVERGLPDFADLVDRQRHDLADDVGHVQVARPVEEGVGDIGRYVDEFVDRPDDIAGLEELADRGEALGQLHDRRDQCPDQGD